MAGDSNKVKDTRKGLDVTTEKKDTGATVKKKQRGLLSRIWNALFRPYGDDYEKKLQHISKEEAAVHARMKKRTLRWRRMTRHLIIFSVLSEVIVVGYAIMTTRQSDLNWKMRAFRVFPMFLLPALSYLAYSGLVSFMKMCDRKDQRTLERLRAERKEKINELKEKTNYYITQQLIQRYDPDPSAKAAAATVLASKLGADSGLQVYIGDQSELHGPTVKSNDVKLVHSNGLCNRKQSYTKSANAESTITQQTEEETLLSSQIVGYKTLKDNDQLVVGHHQPGCNTNGGGWIARFAALLVGEDPAQSYALICGNCHMHNGLAREEDFPYITYYCPHCHALNKSLNLDGKPSSQPDSLNYSATPNNINPIRTKSSSVSENVSSNTSPIAAAAETEEGSEVIVSRDTKSVS